MPPIRADAPGEPLRRLAIESDGVDDATVAAMRDRGHDVELVESGQDALNALSRRGADIVLCDLDMPGMDGKCCLERLRQDSRFDHINIIVYSTNSFSNDISRIESLGATFLKKVNSFDDLCNIIRNLVHHQ